MAPIKKCSCFIFVCCFLSVVPSFHSWVAVGTAHETSAGLRTSNDDTMNGTAENDPHIAFDAAQFDVGEVFEGAVVSHDFIVKNTGTAQLQISDVKPG
jgi:hypothetical protein